MEKIIERYDYLVSQSKQGLKPSHNELLLLIGEIIKELKNIPKLPMTTLGEEKDKLFKPKK